MRIFLVSTGYIDIAHVLVNKCKKKLLKQIVLAAKDTYTLTKYKNRIPLINYSGVEPESGKETPLAKERSRMEQLRETFAASFDRAGDVFMVCGCDTSEVAALPVVQSVCRDKGIGFHVLFIAPFNFEGQRRSQNLWAMMKILGPAYESMSLYYPDELLRRIGRENRTKGEGGMLQQPSLQEALEALEQETAILTLELARQIPKLDPAVQYTYDFKLREFSIAVEPEKILEKTWGSVAVDESKFRDSIELSEEEGLSYLRAIAGETNHEKSDPSGSRPALRGSKDRSGLNRKIPLVGMFAEDSEAQGEGSGSIYDQVTKQSIPVGAFQQQVGSAKLDSLVEGIKVLLGAERGEIVDPERVHMMQSKLLNEINKFQVRQEKAVVKYGADVPTTLRTLDEALGSIYLEDKSLDSDDTGPDDGSYEYDPKSVSRFVGDTPRQRAARTLAENPPGAKTWEQISAERKTEKLKGDGPDVMADPPDTVHEEADAVANMPGRSEQTVSGRSDGPASEKQRADDGPTGNVPAKPSGTGASDVGKVAAPKIGAENGRPPGIGGVAAPDMSKVRAVDAPPAGKSRSGRNKRAAAAMEMLGASRQMQSSSPSQPYYGGRKQNRVDILDSVQDYDENTDAASTVPGEIVTAADTAPHNSSDDRDRTKQKKGSEKSGGLFGDWSKRREERQKEKLRKKLQKAEEKAAIAKARAEEAMKEVEIISKRDHE